MPLNSNLEYEFWMDKDYLVYLTSTVPNNHLSTLSPHHVPHNHNTDIPHSPLKIQIGRLNEMISQQVILESNLIITMDVAHPTVIILHEDGDVSYTHLGLHYKHNVNDYDYSPNQGEKNSQAIAYIMETVYTFTLFDIESKQQLANTKIPVYSWINKNSSGLGQLSNEIDSTSAGSVKNLVDDSLLQLTPIDFKYYNENQYLDEYIDDDYINDQDELNHDDYNMNSKKNDNIYYQIITGVLVQLIFALLLIMYVLSILTNKKEQLIQNGVDHNVSIPLGNNEDNPPKQIKTIHINESKVEYNNEPKPTNRNLCLGEINIGINEKYNYDLNNYIDRNKNDNVKLSPTYNQIEYDDVFIKNYKDGLISKAFNNPPAMNDHTSDLQIVEPVNVDEVRSNLNTTGDLNISTNCQNEFYNQGYYQDLIVDEINNIDQHKNVTENSIVPIIQTSSICRYSQNQFYDGLSASVPNPSQYEQNNNQNNEKNVDINQISKCDYSMSKSTNKLNTVSFVNFLNNTDTDEMNIKEMNFQLNRLNSIDPNMQNKLTNLKNYIHELSQTLKQSNIVNTDHNQILMKLIYMTLKFPKNLSTKSINYVNKLPDDHDDDFINHDHYIDSLKKSSDIIQPENNSQIIEDNQNDNQIKNKNSTLSNENQDNENNQRRKSWSPKTNKSTSIKTNEKFKNQKQELGTKYIQTSTWSNLNNNQNINQNINNYIKLNSNHLQKQPKPYKLGSKSLQFIHYNDEPANPLVRHNSSSTESATSICENRNNESITGENVHVPFITEIATKQVNINNFEQLKDDGSVYSSDSDTSDDETENNTNKSLIKNTDCDDNNDINQIDVNYTLEITNVSNANSVSYSSEKSQKKKNNNQNSIEDISASSIEQKENHTENSINKDFNRQKSGNQQCDEDNKNLIRKQSVPSKNKLKIKRSPSKNDHLKLSSKSYKDEEPYLMPKSSYLDTTTTNKTLLIGKNKPEKNPINEESDDNMLSKHHTFKKFLGSGGFGCVSHFTDKLGLDYAIKRIRIAQQSGQQLKDLDEVNEICILHKCSHPNIVKIHQYWFENQSYDDQFHNAHDESFVLLGSVKKEISKSNHIASFNTLKLYQDSDSESCLNKNSVSRSRVQKKQELDHIQLYIKMEQIDGWVLQDFKETFLNITKTDQYHIVKQIHDALIYTHTIMNIGHRDVKPENIMVVKNDIQGYNMQGGEQQSNYSIKLLDFGISKFINDNPSYQVMQGTPLWISPEQQEGVINFKSDMFSFGLVIFWLFTRSTKTYYMTTFNKLRKCEMEFEGKKSQGYPEPVMTLVRLICIDRIDSWALAKTKQWVQFKNYLLGDENQGNEYLQFQ